MKAREWQPLVVLALFVVSAWRIERAEMMVVDSQRQMIAVTAMEYFGEEVVEVIPRCLRIWISSGAWSLVSRCHGTFEIR